MTVRLTVVVFVSPPPVTRHCNGISSGVALLETASVKVDDPDPGAAISAGLNVAVTPEGKPLADSEIALSNPPEMAAVMVELPEPPWATVRDAGLADSEKFGALPTVTVSEMLVVSVRSTPSAGDRNGIYSSR